MSASNRHRGLPRVAAVTAALARGPAAWPCAAIATFQLVLLGALLCVSLFVPAPRVPALPSPGLRIGLVLLLAAEGLWLVSALARARRLRDELARLRGAQAPLEERLRIAEAAFDAGGAMMITDVQARIVAVNAAFERVTGYLAGEVVGQRPSLFRSGRHDRAFYERMWQALLGCGGWEGEIWDRHKSGRIYPKQMAIRAIRDHTAAITHFVAVFHDLSEWRRAQDELHHLAHFDTLSRLPNRRLLTQRLAQALEECARAGHFGAVVAVDLDRFKILNDTLGRGQADRVLGEIAERLTAAAGTGRVVARSGGDEFMIVLTGLGADAPQAQAQASALAEAVRGRLAVPLMAAGQARHCTASVGVCLFGAQESTAEAVLQWAEIAMHCAKEAGGNQVRCFDPELQRSMAESATIEAELRVALRQDQLRLHFQPQVDRRRRIFAVEALVRWQHPERGLLGPADFLDVAERSGLILDIDTWVLEEACRTLGRWRADPLTAELAIAVNMSARHFNRPGVVDQVGRALQRHGVPARRLLLELTESSALEDVDGAAAKMRALREHWEVGVALDDFGTGFASLSYLQRLPLAQIKIDRSFVRGLTSNVTDAVIVKSIADIGLNFGLQVLGEGVERIDEERALQAIGCEAFQGFLYGRPVPEDRLCELLATPPA